MSTSGSTPDSGCLEPSRIEIARQAKGLSKAGLARALGLTTRSVTNYETDGAPAAMADTLARVLGCDPTFFSMGEVEPLEPERVFFRALRRASASQRHAATAAGRIGVDLYRWIDERYGLPQVDVPEFDHGSPPAAAAAVRAVWGLGDGPLPNLVQLAESRGIRVLGLPKAAEAVDAFSVWSEGFPYVFLCRAKSPERARFDLAHEIGHLILHSRSGAVDSGKGVEREADQFASAFLMPDESLKRTLRFNASISEMLSARSYYGVSAIALNVALNRVGRLTDYAYRDNCIRLAQMGYRSREPGGMKQYEMSKLFPQVFRHARRDHRMTPDRIARELGVLPSELHTLTLGSALTAGAVVAAGAASSEVRRKSGPDRALRVVSREG